MFQQTAARFHGHGFADPLVVTNNNFRFLVAEQLKAHGLQASAILIEPEPRNTAPAILAAAEWLTRSGGDALMLSTPTDHLVPAPEKMRELVKSASGVANDGHIVLFGIMPDRAETGYGWFQVETPPRGSSGSVPVKGFCEKPDAVTARRMLECGDHLWNSGVFLFKASTMIQAIETHACHLIEPVRVAVSEAQPDLGFVRLSREPWSGIQPISIDHAVMESASNLRATAYEAGWSDLGDWESIWRETRSRENGVAVNGPVTAIDCKDTMLRSENPGQKLVGIGLKNVIAVSMPDAALITARDVAQQVRDAVAEIRSEGSYQADEFLRDQRPWGHFVSANQSVYIPQGQIHRLENPGETTLTLIEVQTGTYFGEDDINRYDDVYSGE